MVRNVPEPSAELLDAEDVHQDVVSLTEALERRCAEQRTSEYLKEAAQQLGINLNIER